MGIRAIRAVCYLLILSAVTLFTLGAQAGEKVVLQLRWDHQFQFAGYYVAQWRGYYAAAGLDVDIKSSVTPERKFLSAIKEVSEGRADFGIGAADVLVARDKGHPLVLLASIFQQSAMGIIARKETALSSPADLTQLRVQRYIGDLVDAEFQAILKAEGIDPASIKTPDGLPVGKRPMDLLAEDKIDAFPGYTLGVVWVAKESNIPLTILRPATYGVNFYGDSLFASERLTKKIRNLSVDLSKPASRDGNTRWKIQRKLLKR